MLGTCAMNAGDSGFETERVASPADENSTPTVGTSAATRVIPTAERVDSQRTGRHREVSRPDGNNNSVTVVNRNNKGYQTHEETHAATKPHHGR